MTEPSPITYRVNVVTFYGSDTWTKPANLVRARAIIISGAGGGSSSMGGGGGGVVEIPDRPAALWPETAAVTVGMGGLSGGDGGASALLGIVVPGGKGGVNGGAGAAAIIRGGGGSATVGESVTSAPRSLLAGGGGGGSTGGISGLRILTASGGLAYQAVLQCGRGGSTGALGEWPAGGGGRGGGNGASGCVTIIETLLEE